MDISNKKYFLTVIDYSVSKESFDLYRDEELDMLVTYPKPKLENLDKYYQDLNYISHTDSKRSFFEKGYHLIKKININNKLKLINSLRQEKGTLLDIGTGTGDFLYAANERGWKATGLEPNKKAREKAISKGVSIIDSTDGLENQSFDVITMWHVLEHVPDLEYQVKELKRLLKPKGHLIIAVPNFNSFDAKYYGKYWAAYDVPIHFWHFSKKAIQNIFQKQQIRLVNILPMKFDSFYVSLLSEKYKTGKMNFVKAFFIGLWSNIKAKSKLEYSSHIYVLENEQ